MKRLLCLVLALLLLGACAREPEEVYTVTGLCRCGRVTENGGVAVSYENGAVCETRHFTGLDNERSAGEVVRKCFVLLKHNFLPFFLKK